MARQTGTRTQRALTRLRMQARRCRACPLWEKATQTVFGEGNARARWFFIGEQAGDQEDLAGRPFVGPAGKLLDQALADAGIERAAIYITNVIKHFKFEMRGKRRLHKRANAAEIAACMRWLELELARVRTPYLVCLGALAARILLGADFKLKQQRGTWIRRGPRWVLATVHPAFVLRSRSGGDHAAAYAAFVTDLAKLKRVPRSAGMAQAASPAGGVRGGRRA